MWFAGGWSRFLTSCLLLFPVITLLFLYLELSIMGGTSTIYFRATESQSSLPSSWEDCLEELSPDVTMRDFVSKKPSSVLVYEKAGPAMGNLQSFVYSLGSNLVMEDVIQVLWATKQRQGLLKSSVDRVKVRHAQGRKYDAVFYLDMGPSSPVVDRREEVEEAPVVVQMPLDPAAFTFYDASSSELLFWFNPGSHTTSTRRIGCKSPLLPNATDHAVLLNPFPMHNYSSIFAPFFYERRPQVLSQDVVEVILAFCSEFRSRSFRLGYNSLGATASVNHLHFKLWEYDHGEGPGLPEDALLPIERAHFRILTQEPLPVFELEVRPLTDSSLMAYLPPSLSSGGVCALPLPRLQDYPLYSLAFDVRQSSPQAAAPVIQHFIDYLLHNHIPHSLLVNGELLFLVPRKRMPPPLLSLPVHPEVWGEVRVEHEQDFERMSADEMGQAWRDLSLTRTEFENFCDAVLDYLKRGGTVVSSERR